MQKNRKIKNEIRQITSGIKNLRGQAPALQTLLEYGRTSALPQILATPKGLQATQQPMIPYGNKLARLIVDSDIIDPSESTTESVSFFKYKNEPNSAGYLRKPKLKKQNRRDAHLENSSLMRSRIGTMPSQLTTLKEQLKELPSVGMSPPKHGRRLATDPKEMAVRKNIDDTFSLSKHMSGISLLKQVSVGDSEVQSPELKRQNINSIKYSSLNEKSHQWKKNPMKRRESYISNIKEIIEKSQEDKHERFIHSITEKDRKKWDSAYLRLRKFMSFQDPPCEAVMKLMDQVEQIQQKEQLTIQKEVLSEAKDSIGMKFKLKLDNEHEIHKRRIKMFIESKKRYKIDLVKLTSSKMNASKKETEGVDKVRESSDLNEKKEMPKLDKQSQEQPMVIACSRCGTK